MRVREESASTAPDTSLRGFRAERGRLHDDDCDGPPQTPQTPQRPWKPQNHAETQPQAHSAPSQEAQTTAKQQRPTTVDAESRRHSPTPTSNSKEQLNQPPTERGQARPAQTSLNGRPTAAPPPPAATGQHLYPPAPEQGFTILVIRRWHGRWSTIQLVYSIAISLPLLVQSPYYTCVYILLYKCCVSQTHFRYRYTIPF